MKLKDQVEAMESYMVPTLHLTSKEIKDLSKWQVGDKHEIELDATLKSLTKLESGKFEGCFEINKVRES